MGVLELVRDFTVESLTGLLGKTFGQFYPVLPKGNRVKPG